MAEVAALGLKVTGVSDIDNASSSLDRFTKSGENAERSSGGLADGSRRAATGVKAAGDASERSSRQVNTLASAARLARVALVAMGGVAVFRQSIGQIANFQEAVNGLAAVSGATADEMARLEDQARLLGATSRFSAQQAAEGQRFLAQAGFEVNEILSATPGILQLATAGSLDLATAADIASNVLGGMRLEVDQLNRVNDVLAATAARSNTTIEQLGKALSFAAPFAAGAGIEIEEVAAAIGVMSDAGIQASRAGTGMVGVIRQLSKVTTEGERVLAKYGLSVEDVNIEARGLGPVLETLRDANLNTADAIALFGSEAGAAAQVLVSDYKGAIEGATGEAERMANQMNQGLVPAFLGLASAAAESVLQIGDSGLAGGLERLVVSATGVISVWNGMGGEWAEANGIGADMQGIVEGVASALEVLAKAALALVAARLGSYIYATSASFVAAQVSAARYHLTIAQLVGMSRTAVAAQTALAVAARGASAAMALVGGPAGLAVLAAAGIYALATSNREAADAASSHAERIEQLNRELESLTKTRNEQVTEELRGIQDAARARGNALRAEQAQIKERIEDYKRLIDESRFNPDAADRLRRSLAALTKMQDENSEKIREQDRIYADAERTLQGFNKQQEETERAAKRVAKSFSEESSALDKLRQSIADQVYEIENGQQAYEIMIAQRRAGVDAASAEGQAIAELIKERDRLLESKNAIDEAAKSWANLGEAIAEQQLQLSGSEAVREAAIADIRATGEAAGISAEQIRQLIEAQRQLWAASDQDAINNEASRIAESLRTEEESILASYERRRQIILDNTQYTGEAQMELLRRLEEQKDEELLALNGSYWEKWLQGAENALGNFDELAMSVLEGFSRQWGDAFESMIFDSESLGDVVSNMAVSMARSIVNSLGQMAAQWVTYHAVQAALGKSSEASAIAGAVTSGTAIAAAYAPAAAAASLASFGANSVPAMAGISSTYGLTQALSIVSVPGFREGGYTGGGGVNDIAGVVHGKEYVFDAAATARIGVGRLDAMRKGQDSQGSAPAVGGTVLIQQDFTVNGDVSPQTIELMREATRQGAQEGYRMVLDDFNNNGPARRRLRA